MFNISICTQEHTGCSLVLIINSDVNNWVIGCCAVIGFLNNGSIFSLFQVKKGFRQLVEDAVRSALKGAWSLKKITKEEYKDIFKKSVEKVAFKYKKVFLKFLAKVLGV